MITRETGLMQDIQIHKDLQNWFIMAACRGWCGSIQKGPQYNESRRVQADTWHSLWCPGQVHVRRPKGLHQKPGDAIQGKGQSSLRKQKLAFLPVSLYSMQATSPPLLSLTHEAGLPSSGLPWASPRAMWPSQLVLLISGDTTVACPRGGWPSSVLA